MDEDFVTRLLQCLDVFPSGAKVMLLAFDFHYDEQGERREDLERILRTEPLRSGACPTLSRSLGVDLFGSSIPL